jgi:uncharacterized protein
MDDIGPELVTKNARLREIILGFDRVAVAFSGGVDSSFLLSACVDALGAERVLAITADSPLLPRAELRTAREVAQLLGVQHRVVAFDDLAIPEVVANPPRRCYYCKRARFEALLALAREMPGTQLLHGENADDPLDYRPGSQAAQELGVRAPLAEAGLTKAEIRQLSRHRGLPTWNHPAAACLATRFPYNTPLTREALERVEAAEEVLHELLGAWQQLRLRDHHPIARIEVPTNAIARVIEPGVRRVLVERLHKLGYRYVTLDLDGYRMGSLNEGITTSS